VYYSFYFSPIPLAFQLLNSVLDPDLGCFSMRFSYIIGIFTILVMFSLWNCVTIETFSQHRKQKRLGIFNFANLSLRRIRDENARIQSGINIPDPLRKGRLFPWDFIYFTQSWFLPALRRLWGKTGSNPGLLRDSLVSVSELNHWATTSSHGSSVRGCGSIPDPHHCIEYGSKPQREAYHLPL
jgi:hypothetical protein